MKMIEMSAGNWVADKVKVKVYANGSFTLFDYRFRFEWADDGERFTVFGDSWGTPVAYGMKLMEGGWLVSNEKDFGVYWPEHGLYGYGMTRKDQDHMKATVSLLANII